MNSAALRRQTRAALHALRTAWSSLPPITWLTTALKPAPPRKPEPDHLRRGRAGEAAARSFLERAGLQFLTANFRSRRGELDLVFRDRDCLVFVEVKTRTREDWTRPATAVDRRKRRALSLTALDYLRQLRNPRARFRFDIVEVILEDDAIRDIRHIPNAFPFARPNFYA